MDRDSLRRHGVVVDAVAARKDSLVAGLVSLILRQLASIAPVEWYDDRVVERFAAGGAAQIREGQTIAGNLSAEALMQAFTEQGVRLKSEPVVLPKDPRGVPAEEVWTRPAKEYRRQKALGKTDAEAVNLAAERARRMVADDVSLASREGERQRAMKSPAVGMRRVIHPELSRSGTCGLCVVASDRVYWPQDLRAVHTNCQCEPLPIVVRNGVTLDPGRSLNEDFLKQLYKDAGGSTSREALKLTRYQVTEHGELGPVLTRKSAYVKKKPARDMRAKHAEQVAAQRDRLESDMDEMTQRIEELQAAGETGRAARVERLREDYRRRLARLAA